MTRLYFDQLKASGTRYYFALDAVPGIVVPGVATLTLFGRAPAAAEPTTVFRTPAPAMLTLAGLSLQSPGVLSPAQAALTLAGLVPGKFTEIVIRVSAPASVETAEPTYEPTLITQMTVAPGRALLTLLTLEQNVTQGGNIGFVSPGLATLTLTTGGASVTLGFGAGPPAALTIQGFAPTLTLNSVGTVNPGVGLLTVTGNAPLLTLPFVWIDDDPPASPTWIDDAAA